MGQGLSVSSISVNEETIKILPNSFDGIKLGTGDRNTRWASSGGSAGESVTTINAEMLNGSFTFKMLNVAENIAKVQLWTSRVDNNVVQAQHAFFKDGVKQYQVLTFDHAAIQEDPEIALTSDGDITINWKSDPVSFQ